MRMQSSLNGLVALAAAVGLTALLAAGCSGTNATTTAAPGSAAAPAPSGSTIPAKTDVPERFANATSAMYQQDAMWLCRPGLAKDHCSTDSLDSTILTADGRQTPATRAPVKDAPVDCFYVYPTVNLAPGGGNKMDLSAPGLEATVVNQQAARFTDVCNVYAPLYRQMNLSAYSMAEAERNKADAIAYGDVKDAFTYYMGHFNRGRPIVLIGHSQGSGELAHLLSDEFDDDPAMQAKLVSALLIGGFVQVPAGKDVGGTFQHLPLCRSTTQTACIVTYNTYGTDPAPIGPFLFGRTTDDGLVGACVNPGAPAGGSAMLEPYAAASSSVGQAHHITTPFVQLPDAMTAECHTDNGHTYLGVTAATRPGDARDVSAMVANTPGWGLHITEFNLTMGNLLDLVRTQIAAAPK